MLNLDQYPFKTAKTIDGKVYITVDEVKQILEDLRQLGPVFQQVADAATKLKDAFADGQVKSERLLTELKKDVGISE